MQCVILSGGLGTRLGQLGRRRPKHLVPVLGRPFAHRQLEWLADQGVESVLQCVGHRGDEIRASVGDGSAFGLAVAYSDDGSDAQERPRRLGTGGALLLARQRGILAERFIVVYGDSWLRMDLATMWRAAQANAQPVTMAVIDNVNGREPSNVALERGLVRYHKGAGESDAAASPLRTHLDYGATVMRADVLDPLMTAGFDGDPPQIDLAEVMATWSAKSLVAAFEVDQPYDEVGTPEGIARLEAALLAEEGAGCHHAGIMSAEQPTKPTHVLRHPHDPALELWVPESDVADPEVSIVIPALDESITIEAFVQWCHQGLEQAGVRGEILIVDSSSDDTPNLALAGGARVLRTPKRGLGRAYLDAIDVIRGEWVIMGDADCTYDFRELAAFIEAFRGGSEFVMGSRWKGTIEPGSMPALHRWFGTPVTTWILNLLYDSDFSDIHCGMRGITKEALVRMGLVSQSWEYASEMVIKSVHLGLRTSEVPVSFLKDVEGRESHHRRAGWFSPFSAAWINLKAMFVHGADFFLVRPGLLALVMGIVLTVPLVAGPITIGSLTFTLTTMIFGLVFCTLGIFSYQLGMLARVIYDRRGMVTARLMRRYRYTRTVGTAMAAGALGAAATIPLLVRFATNNFTLTTSDLPVAHLAIAGLTLGVVSFATFAFTLLLHALAANPRR